MPLIENGPEIPVIRVIVCTRLVRLVMTIRLVTLLPTITAPKRRDDDDTPNVAACPRAPGRGSPNPNTLPSVPT